MNDSLAFLYATKTLSCKLATIVRTVNNIKITAYKILDLINESSGEKVSMPTINISARINAKDALTVKQELIKLTALSLESGKNLIRLILNPRFDMSARSPIADIIVDAKPTSCAVYNLAAINQKINPATLPKMEFATR
jgi:hypothetical protein